MKMIVHFLPKGFTEMDAIIKPELTMREIADIDMRAMGNIILDISKLLSKKVNDELLEPISCWLDDPGWLERFQIDDKDTPNWAVYKQKQRQWTQQQKAMATERLRLYWQEIRKKHRFRKEVSNILSANKKSRNLTNIQLFKTGNLKENFLTHIIAPFRPKEQQRTKTNREFQNARTMPISNLLPWRLLLSSELSTVTHFKDFKTYCSTKKDIISKFIHLLQMETDGEINLLQDRPFGDIKIEPLNVAPEQEITIKDQNGQEYHFGWQELSDCQRNKIVDDIKANRILCKTA